MPGVDRSATTETRRARVLAVDDQTQFLAVLRDLVCATRELEPVAEAHSGERAIEAVRETEPDMVLMDVWMPGIGGIAAAREIKAGRPSTLVVLISTTHPDELPLQPGRHSAPTRSSGRANSSHGCWTTSGCDIETSLPPASA